MSPNKSGKERKESPDCPKERFRGAKQLFMSLERKKDKNKDKKIVKGEGEPSPHRVLSPTRSSNKEQVHFYQYLGAQLYHWLSLYG